MKKERNECYVALSRGTRNKLNRAVFKSMLVATNYYVVFAEDKNQREELEQFITALRRAAHVEL